LILFFSVNPPLSQIHLQELFEVEKEISEESEFVENLEELEKNPLDLNRASVADLLRIPWLSPPIAQKIVSQRKLLGPFRSFDDLEKIGLEKELLTKIRPYFKLSHFPSSKKSSFEVRSRVSLTLPLSEGYKVEEGEKRFFSSPLKLYNRFRLTQDRVEVRVLAEKDPGEKSSFDLLTFGLELPKFLFGSRLLLGNYALEFGQGLLFSPQTITFKSGELINQIKKKSSGVKNYTSTDEISSLFGGAITASQKTFATILFLSDRRLDATLNEDGTVKRIVEGGFHRNLLEERTKNRLHEKLYGFRQEWNLWSGLKIGSTLYQSLYHPPFYSPSPFVFKGGKNFLFGLDWDGTIEKVNFFGEYAKSWENGQGILLGSIVDFGKIGLGFLYRNYSPFFYSPHSHGFADSDDENEVGIFSAFNCRLIPRTTVSLYLDQFSHPLPRYLEKMPTKGEEMEIKVSHQFPMGLEITVRHILNNDGESWKRRGLRGNFLWRVSPRLSWEGRIERVWRKNGEENSRESGDLAFCGFSSEPYKGFSFQTRIIYFSTDSYEARIYECEEDLPGGVTNLSLYGRGRRYYLLFRKRVRESFGLSFKMAQTYKLGVDSLGSGLEERKGNTEQNYGLQVDINWN